MLEFVSVPDFLMAHEDNIFEFWVYRKVYTPYEQQQAFLDESVYEDTNAIFGIIAECISLGSGDFMLGFRTIADPDEEGAKEYNGPIEYYKLSEIRMRLYYPTLSEEE